MALTQLQDRLWRELPVLKDPVMQSLGWINTDRQVLDQEVRRDMRTGAARLRANRCTHTPWTRRVEAQWVKY